HKVIEEAKVIYDERKRIVKTSLLNEILQKEIRITPPASVKGREVKINYITQLKSAPIIFAFFVNEPKLIKDNYKKFLEKKIREHFGFKGVPVGLVFKKKN
nr:ribosome biogenesis GTPase Der [Bacteroidota bacterium]